MAFKHALSKARRKRGLSFYALSQATIDPSDPDGRPNCAEQSIKNLEWGACDPAQVTFRSMYSLTVALWPLLKLSDWVPGAVLRLELEKPAQATKGDDSGRASEAESGGVPA